MAVVTLPPGWLTDEEAEELRRLASGEVVLELGAWKGRSTVVLAETARYVVSVDRHTGIPIIPDSGDSLADYLEMVRPLPNVAIVVADFAWLVPLFRAYEFGLVYVDGDHDATAVARDAMLASRLKPKWVAFHDWDFPSVREGVSYELGDDAQPVGVVGSIAVFG